MGEIAKKSTDFSTLANDVMRFAIQIKDAGDFIPAAMKGKPGAIAACMLTGIELGLEPMASLRLLYVQSGHVGISSTGMIALLKKRGYKIEWPDNEAEKVTIKLTAPDGSEFEMSYTKEDAAKAGLWDKVHNSGAPSVWKLHPKAMLRARCISNAAKVFAAEVLAGVYSPDEIDEIKEREEKLVNPTPESGKEPRKLGVEAVLDDLGLTDEAEEFKEVKNVEEVSEVEEPKVIEEPEEPEETTESVLTDAELISDEMKCANNVKQLDLCAKKVKLACITEDQKELLRDEYKKLKEGLSI